MLIYCIDTAIVFLSFFCFVEEIARQMENSGATVVVTFPMMVDTMRQVAQKCPSIRRMIVLGSAEGFVSLKDMLHDSGEYFDDNIEVLLI